MSDQTRALAIVALLLVSRLSPIAYCAEPGQTHYYQGTIGPDLPVQAEISFTPGEKQLRLSGSYRYDKEGKSIALTGGMPYATEGALFTVTEQVEKDDGAKVTTGTWSLTRDDMTLDLHGTWTSPDGNRSLQVKLTCIADLFRMERSLSSTAMVGVSFPVFREKSLRPLQAYLEKEHVSQLAAFIGEVQGYFPADDGDGVRVVPRFAPHALDLSLTPRLVRPPLVSLQYHAYTYTGGAHPNSGEASATFLVKDGESTPVPLAMLLKTPDASLPVLSQRCHKKLVTAGASFLPKPEEFSLGQDHAYYLTPAGLVLVFSPYEVASYAEGFFRIDFPYAEIKDLIDPKGPAGALIK